MMNLIPPSGSLLSSLCGSADFEGSVAIAVALGLSAMSQQSVRMSTISNIRLSFCPGRRLTAAEPAAERVTMMYTATVGFDLGMALKGHLEVPRTNHAFARTFGEALSTSTGMTVMSVQASTLEVLVEFVLAAPGQSLEVNNTDNESSLVGDNISIALPGRDVGSDAELLMAVVIGPTFFCVCCCCGICCYLALTRRKRSKYVTAITPLDPKRISG
jgi:hypothetical protein